MVFLKSMKNLKVLLLALVLFIGIGLAPQTASAQYMPECTMIGNNGVETWDVYEFWFDTYGEFHTSYTNHGYDWCTGNSW
jgi:hypothetical protein